MSITDELRTYTGDFYLRRYKDVREKLEAIADRIDAEHERQLGVLYRDMSDAEWVRLPVDADGVPINIGDVLTDGAEFESEGVVKCLMLDKSGWFVGFGNGWTDAKIHEWRHYHKPTVEDMLWELLGKISPSMEDEEAVPIVKAYAEKLSLADDGKGQQ